MYFKKEQLKEKLYLKYYVKKKLLRIIQCRVVTLPRIPGKIREFENWQNNKGPGIYFFFLKPRKVREFHKTLWQLCNFGMSKLESECDCYYFKLCQTVVFFKKTSMDSQEISFSYLSGNPVSSFKNFCVKF
jgi:hypothetical protein